MFAGTFLLMCAWRGRVVSLGLEWRASGVAFGGSGGSGGFAGRLFAGVAEIVGVYVV